MILHENGRLYGDLRIRNGLIAEMGENLAAEDARLVDATGQYLIPGGIDPHVHLHLRVNNIYSSDNFTSGSKAALYGGTTTVIDFVTPDQSQSLTEALAQRKLDATGSYCDYSFHVSPVDLHPGIEQEILDCLSAGINSFKIYLAYKESIGIDDQTLERIMYIIHEHGGMVTAHCEDGDAVESMRNQLFEAGKTGPENHPLSRPGIFETTSVEKLIKTGKKTGCPVYIVHVSTQGSVEHIKKAQDQGQAVFAESCPQYLLLDESLYSPDTDTSIRHICSPPYRLQKDRNSIWKAISEGYIHTIGTDHCPFDLTVKQKFTNDFRKIPNGIGGIEHRMQLLFSEGVLTGKITLEKWLEICSGNAAKIFGLSNKGILKSGFDADIVIWDPNYQETISSERHHMNCDTNVYEGMVVKGKATQVFQRGIQLIQNGQLRDIEPTGRFISRDQVDHLTLVNQIITN